MNSVERIKVFVFEPDTQAKKQLRDCFVMYSVRYNIELEISWMSVLGDCGIEKLVCDAAFAFVNLSNQQQATYIGETIYKYNNMCSLFYYGKISCSDKDELTRYFKKLFPSRPIGYLEKADKTEVFAALDIYGSVKEKMFRFKTKGMIYRIPYNSILYFKSDRNHIILKLFSGIEYMFPGKLSMLGFDEQSADFIRVHQSYLINKKYITVVNKSNKSVLLNNGEEIFISKAHYKTVTDNC